MSEQFEDFTPNPDAGLWQSIDSALDRKERRSKFIWYWLAAGVLLSVVGAGLLQWNSSHKGNRTASVAQVQNKNQRASGKNPEARSIETPALDDAWVSNQKLADKPAEVAKTERVIRKSTYSEPRKVNIEVPRPSALEQVTERENNYSLDVQPMDIDAMWFDGMGEGGILLSQTPALAWNRAARKSLMPGRWSVEMGVDANQTGLVYRAKNDYANYIHKNYFDRMKSGEFALSAGRVQGALIYQITPKHAVKVGLAYAENRTLQRFDFRDSMPATVIQGQKADALGYYPIFGYLGLGPQVNFESQSTYTMLSIPVGYTGHFPWKKGLSVTPEVLVSANRLGVSAGAQTLDYQTLMQKSQDASQMRAWVMGMRVAMGIEKRLNYSHAIGLRLNAQSMLSPMYVPNAALQSRGWSAGLSAHYSWRIQ